MLFTELGLLNCKIARILVLLGRNLALGYLLEPARSTKEVPKGQNPVPDLAGDET
jgi:hypothetical protein